MAKIKNKVFLHLEVPEELRDALIEMAKQDYSNLSSYVRTILRRHLNMAENSPYKGKLKTQFEKNIEKTMIEKGDLKFDDKKISEEEKDFEESLKSSL